MKRVIAPIDFSDKSYRLIKASVKLAQRMDVAVEIIHVIDSFEYGVNFVINEANPIFLPPNVLNDKVGKAQENFQKIMEELHKNIEQLPEIFMSVKTGFVFDVISEQLQDPEVVMVMLSDKSQADYNYRDISQKHEDIINETNCPVCIIPNEAPFNDPKNIIYATNYHHQDIDNIADIIKTASKVESKIHIVHITENNNYREQLTMQGLKNEIETKIEYENIIYKIIESDDTIQGLDDYANSADADRIAILRENKSLFQGLFGKNKTRKLVYKTNLPVLIYQEKRKSK